MSRKITSEEILRAVTTEREDQIASVLMDGEIRMPYTYRHFSRDMNATGLVVSECTVRKKWQILIDQGYIADRATPTLDISRMVNVLTAELRTLLRRATEPSYGEITKTKTNTVNKDARVIQMEGSE